MTYDIYYLTNIFYSYSEREREREGWGVEKIGGDGSETGSVMKKGKKSTTSIGASLTLDFGDKEEGNNNFNLRAFALKLHIHKA